MIAYRPALWELRFRERLLSDEETMAYNAAWDGTIPFPEEKWESWYSRWLEAPARQRYYRYLYALELDAFVGEIAYHHQILNSLFSKHSDGQILSLCMRDC